MESIDLIKTVALAGMLGILLGWATERTREAFEKSNP